MQDIYKTALAAMRKAASMQQDGQVKQGASWGDRIQQGIDRAGAKVYDAVGRAQDWAADKIGNYYGRRMIAENNARTQQNRDMRAFDQVANDAYKSGNGFLARAAQWQAATGRAGNYLANYKSPATRVGNALGNSVLDAYDNWRHGAPTAARLGLLGRTVANTGKGTLSGLGYNPMGMAAGALRAANGK